MKSTPVCQWKWILLNIQILPCELHTVFLDQCCFSRFFGSPFILPWVLNRSPKLGPHWIPILKNLGPTKLESNTPHRLGKSPKTYSCKKGYLKQRNNSRTVCYPTFLFRIFKRSFGHALFPDRRPPSDWRRLARLDPSLSTMLPKMPEPKSPCQRRPPKCLSQNVDFLTKIHTISPSHVIVWASISGLTFTKKITS